MPLTTMIVALAVIFVLGAIALKALDQMHVRLMSDIGKYEVDYPVDDPEDEPIQVEDDGTRDSVISFVDGQYGRDK